MSLNYYKYNNLQNRVKTLENLILNEAKQVGTLYHICTLEAYLKYILPKDELKASGSYINWLYKGRDFISFTRDKYFVVETDTIDDSHILIQLVIDGDKLSERYKVRPYNDFMYDIDGSIDYDMDDPEHREMEESVKGPIKNLSKYIKHIYIDVKGNFNINDLEQIKSNAQALSSAGCKYFPFIRNKHNVKLRKTLDSLNKGSDIINFLNYLEEYIKTTVNVVDNNGQTLLHKCDNVATVKHLIELGADVDIKDNNGNTPLHIYEDDEIVKLLINAGADVNIKNIIGWTPIFKLRLHPNVAKALISAGTDVNARANDGDTPLHVCTNAAAAKVLIDAGADVNAQNDEGRTPLHNRELNKNVAKVLIDAGADVNIRDNGGRTPLNFTSDYDVKKLLINAGGIK